MLAAGTLRFADAPDARAARDGDGDSKPPRLQVASSPRGKEKEEARSGASTRWRGTEKDSSSAFSHRDVDATPRLRELTTPDAALEPARRADTRVRRAPGDATPTAARGVETAFEDSATATTTPSDSRSDDAPPRATFEEERSRVRHRDAETRDADACDDTRDFASDLSSLREWTRELRAYQRAFAEDGVNDESAARAAGAFLRKHLTRADAAVREMVARRDALVARTRSVPFDGSTERSASAARKSRLLRKLQLFDAAAFAALSDVAEAQTRRFFEPLREVSASMFARFLKSKFSGAGCSEDRAVDFASVGEAGARLERRHGGGSGLALGRALRADAAGDSETAGAFAVAPAVSAEVRAERDAARAASKAGFESLDGVFRRDGADGSPGGWTEFGVARRSKRSARANGSKGPIARPDVDDGLGSARGKAASDARARARARRLVASLRASGPRDLVRDLAFDPRSFARTVENLFDVASLVAGGEAALEANEAGDDARARAAEPRETERATRDFSGGGDETRGNAEDGDAARGAFVLRLDLATWRALGGAADLGLDERARRGPATENHDEDFGFGFDDDGDGDDGGGDDGGGDDGVAAFSESARMFSDGVRMRGIMPLGADPFEALLDDDFDAASRAHHSLNLAPREGAIVAGMAYVYREGFMDETFFRDWASDMLVTFYHFSLAATEGGPAHTLATRAVWRVARHWLENNPEMPTGATSEDVLFFNEGCYVLRALGIPHETLARQLDRHLARFESREYFRGLDLSKPDSFRVRAETPSGAWETAPPSNVGVAAKSAGSAAVLEDTKDGILEDAAAVSEKTKNEKRKGKRGTRPAAASRVRAAGARPRRLLDVGDGDVKKFNTALIWSFFFKESGAETKTFAETKMGTAETVAAPIWRGDTAEEIRAAADAEVDLSHALSLHPDDARAALDFDDVCYFVTHKIFVATNWGLKRARKEEWKEERAFLKTHLPYAMTGAKHGYGDVHLVGEFVQCLRCFDDVARVDPDVAEATRWMLSRQNKQTGGWEVLDADFKNSYHATICALGALLTPKMRGVAEKAKQKVSRGATAKKSRRADAGTVLETGRSPRRSVRGVVRDSLKEAETRERRAAWDAARALPWETAKRKRTRVA